MFLRKGVLKICSKFTGEHPCRSVISIKLQSNFIEITLWHGCSPVNLLRIFRTLFSKNTFGWLLLYISITSRQNIIQVVKYFSFDKHQPTESPSPNSLVISSDVNIKNRVNFGFFILRYFLP